MYPRRCWDSGLILTLLRFIGQPVLHFLRRHSIASRTDHEAAARIRAGAGRPHLHRENQPAIPVRAKGHARRVRAIANGWLWLHGSGTFFVKFTEAGAELFA